MAFLQQLYSDLMKWRLETDEVGRPIVRIYTVEQLQNFILHPDKLPSGDLHFYSLIPIGDAHKVLFDVLGKCRPGIRVGLTGPIPQEVQNKLKHDMGSVLDLELEGASNLPLEKLNDLRNKVAIAAEDGLLAVPNFLGDEFLAKAWIEEFNIHKHDICPVEKWLQTELDILIPVAATLIGRPVQDFKNQIVLCCQGGIEGMVPTFCKSVGSKPPYTIEVGHGFYYALSVASWSCAARVRLSEQEEKKITAKEINDSLRGLVAWYTKRIELPQIVSFVHSLLPHQLVIAEGLIRGMRRFAIAHELGHILLNEMDGDSSKINLAQEHLGKMAALYRIPFERQEEWATEFACDLLAIKLLQDSLSLDPSLNPEALPREDIMTFHWDFAGADFSLTLWEHLASAGRDAGKLLSESHPPGEARKLLIRMAYPEWIQDFGLNLSKMLDARLPNI